MNNLQVSKGKSQKTVNGGEYVGFGGWLYVYFFGLIVAFGSSLNGIFEKRIFLQDEDYQHLFDSNSESYSSLWKPLLWGEVFVDIITILFVLAIAYYCFKRSSKFPKLAISYMAIVLLSNIALAVLMHFLNATYLTPMIAKKEIAGMVFKSIVYSAIWIPYMLFSQRVKNTYMN